MCVPFRGPLPDRETEAIGFEYAIHVPPRLGELLVSEKVT